MTHDAPAFAKIDAHPGLYHVDDDFDFWDLEYSDDSIRPTYDGPCAGYQNDSYGSSGLMFVAALDGSQFWIVDYDADDEVVTRVQHQLDLHEALANWEQAHIDRFGLASDQVHVGFNAR